MRILGWRRMIADAVPIVALVGVLVYALCSAAPPPTVLRWYWDTDRPSESQIGPRLYITDGSPATALRLRVTWTTSMQYRGVATAASQSVYGWAPTDRQWWRLYWTPAGTDDWVLIADGQHDTDYGVATSMLPWVPWWSQKQLQEETTEVLITDPGLVGELTEIVGLRFRALSGGSMSAQHQGWGTVTWTAGVQRWLEVGVEVVP